MNILIVDDEHLIRNWLKLFIQQVRQDINKNIYEAANGQEAFDLIGQHSFDLVITDINMPVINGVELVQGIARDYPEVMTAVLSAYSELSDVKTALKAGTSDYILKAEMQAADIENLINETEKRKTYQNRFSQKQLTQILTQKAVFESYLLHAPKAFTDFFTSAKKGFSYLCVLLEIAHKTPLYLDELSIATALYRSLEKQGCFLLTVPLHYNRYFIILENGLIKAPHLQLQSDLLNSKLRDCLQALGRHIVCSSQRSITDIEKLHTEFIEMNRQFSKYRYYVDFKPGMFLAAMKCEQEHFRSLFKTGLTGVLFDDDSCNVSTLLKLMKNHQYNEILILIPSLFERLHLNKSEPIAIKSLVNMIFNAPIFNRLSALQTIEELPNSLGQLSEQVLNTESSYQLLLILTKWYRQQYELHLHKRNESTPIDLATQYILANYREKLTLEIVGKAVHLNCSYLSYLFKKETGFQFTEYIESVRIHEACKLLQSSQDLIGDIAFKVGFTSQAYFTRQFKKASGLNPAEFRRTRLLE